MVKLLIRWKCDQDDDNHNLTAVHWAAERGHADCLEVLLQAGRNPNCATYYEYYGEY